MELQAAASFLSFISLTPEFDYYQPFSSLKNSAHISIYLNCLFSDQATRVDWFQLASNKSQAADFDTELYLYEIRLRASFWNELLIQVSSSSSSSSSLSFPSISDHEKASIFISLADFALSTLFWIHCPYIWLPIISRTNISFMMLAFDSDTY